MSTLTPNMERRVTRKTLAGAPAPGFAGPGHTAVEVVAPTALADTDPFVILADDTLDFRPGQPVGEAHPHAGLETVTLMLEGCLSDKEEGLLEEGDLAWMTAGRGLVHNEDVKATGRARVLQLWGALASRDRDSAPDLQILPLSGLPVRRETGVEARVYSGRSGGAVSTTRNRVPMIVVDFRLEPSATVTQELPGSFRAFAYLTSGEAEIGGMPLTVAEIAWLDPSAAQETFVRLAAGPTGARVIFYAGEPLKEPIVQRGPFVAGSDEEFAEQYQAFRAGRFGRLSELANQQAS